LDLRKILNDMGCVVRLRQILARLWQLVDNWVLKNDWSILDGWVAGVRLSILSGNLVFHFNTVQTEWAFLLIRVLLIAFNELLNDFFLVDIGTTEGAFGVCAFECDELVVAVLVELVMGMAAQELDVGADLELTGAQRAQVMLLRVREWTDQRCAQCAASLLNLGLP
jgi:hypothetical protein